MPTPEIEELAETLVRVVRDAAVRAADSNLYPLARSPLAVRWRHAASQDGAEAIVSVVPDCVDETIFQLLHAIDSGALRLSFTASNGRTVDLAHEGLSELAGWYMGSPGWRGAYSRERFVDDLADLAGD